MTSAQVESGMVAFVFKRNVNPNSRCFQRLLIRSILKHSFRRKYRNTTIAGVDYLTLSGEGYLYSNQPGDPALPVVRKMVGRPWVPKCRLRSLRASPRLSVSLPWAESHDRPGAGQPKCGDPVAPTALNAQIYSSVITPQNLPPSSTTLSFVHGLCCLRSPGSL